MKVMEHAAAPGTKGTAKNILIVDDDSDTRWLLGELLASEGYAVQAAESAEAAMMLLYTFRPDAVLMDVRLPGMDGLQLTRSHPVNNVQEGPYFGCDRGRQ
jgi:two-component system phosphate regulon response regulator OmpR